MMLTLRVAAQ